jgi:hypothetical protein
VYVCDSDDRAVVLREDDSHVAKPIIKIEFLCPRPADRYQHRTTVSGAYDIGILKDGIEQPRPDAALLAALVGVTGEGRLCCCI